MRRTETPDERGICLHVLRSLRGWTQEELAKALGIPASAISEYERGKRYVPERIVRRAAEKVGIPTRKLLDLEALLRDLRGSLGSEPLPKSDFRDRVTEKISLGFEDIARRAVETVLSSSQVWKGSSGSRGDLIPADVLWMELERCGEEERRLVVEEGVEYQTWGLCKLLCEKSLEAADGEGPALELAELALFVAERVSGEEDWQAGVQAFAWAHLGYARRKRGDRSGAEEAFARFRVLWHPEASRPLLLDGGRISDLEALVADGAG